MSFCGISYNVLILLIINIRDPYYKCPKMNTSENICYQNNNKHESLLFNLSIGKVASA